MSTDLQSALAPELLAKAGRELLGRRRSVRGYQDREPSREDIVSVLQLAARAASGGNIQPWRVYVLTGAAKARLTEEILEHRSSGRQPPRCEYLYPTPSREPYRTRMKSLGKQLYAVLGIAHDDLAARSDQVDRNFSFFGAPVGLVFTLDRNLGEGAFLELGIFLGAVMAAARAYGLDTCPQAAVAWYHEIIRRQLALPADEMVILGMALGFADWGHPANRLRSEREPVETFTAFLTE